MHADIGRDEHRTPVLVVLNSLGSWRHGCVGFAPRTGWRLESRSPCGESSWWAVPERASRPWRSASRMSSAHRTSNSTPCTGDRIGPRIGRGAEREGAAGDHRCRVGRGRQLPGQDRQSGVGVGGRCGVGGSASTNGDVAVHQSDDAACRDARRAVERQPGALAGLLFWRGETSIVWWAWTSYARDRERYEAAMRDPGNRRLTFHRLRTRHEIERFLQALQGPPALDAGRGSPAE